MIDNYSNKKLIPLDYVQVNRKAKIVSINGGYGIRQRLYEMGLTPGTEVVIISNTGRGPLLISTRGITLAIGRGVARKILVEVNY